MPLTHFKDYEIIRQISESPQSEVYQVRKGENFFAFKLYKSGLKPLSSLKTNLKNPYLLPSLDSGIYEKCFFELFEWFESHTLETQTTQNLQTQLKITAQTLQGLNFLHYQGLVHADLKNSNLLINKNNQIKIIDLGIAKKNSTHNPHQLPSGSLAYMAPELLFNAAPHAGSDLYALGMTLYFCIFGKFPFSKLTSDEVIHWHLFEKVSAPSENIQAQAKPFIYWIFRLLTKDPVDRPRSCEEALKLLQNDYPELEDYKLSPQSTSSKKQSESLAFVELHGQAIEFYENILKRSSAENLILAELYYRQGHFQKALHLLEDKNNEKVELLKIKLYLRMGKFEEASKSFEKFKYPDSFDSLNLKGILAYHQSKIEDSLGYFKQSKSLLSQNSDYNALALSYNNLGNLLLEKKEMKEAKSFFDQALSLAQKSNNVIFEGMFEMSLGYFYHRNKKTPQALDHYTTSKEILSRCGQKAELARTLLNCGNLFLETKNFEKARLDLKEAEKIFEQKKQSYYQAYSQLLLGSVCLQQNQFTEATPYLKSAEYYFKSQGHLKELQWTQEQMKEIEMMSQNNFYSDELEKLKQEIVAELNPQKLVEIILDRLIEITKAERGYIILLKEEKKEVALTRIKGKSAGDPSKDQVSQSIVEQALREGKIILSVNAQEDERFSVLQSVHALKLRSILCIPFHKQGKNLGVIYLDHRSTAGVFLPSLAPGLKPFAELLAQSLENARRFESIEEDLNKTQRALSSAELALEAQSEFRNMVGQDPKMKELFKMLERVSDIDVSVLILGESGVGKEKIARALHTHSARSSKAFISLNCQSIPETLFESELFGHVKGAFTGADRDRQGLIEQAEGGTLFLDEIGDMPLAMQGKLLRVLQEKKLRRLGDKQERNCNVRIVSATHRNLRSMVDAKEFREDLWYRLNVVEIKVPALRERKEDIPLLAAYFLKAFHKQKGIKLKKLSSSALQLLMKYEWPGNIRELENTLLNASIFSEKDQLQENDFRYKQELFPLAAIKGSVSKKLLDQIKPFNSYREMIDQLEERILSETLKETDFNITLAAERLKIARPQLSRMIKKFGIQ